MTMNDYQGIKYFKFLHCWVDNDSFMDTVTSCWNKEVHGNPMWRWHQKMKRLTTTLSAWSKREFGDIYSKVKEFEEKVKVAEEELINNNTGTNRHNLHYINATYIKYLKIEEEILKQKTQLQWFKEGDANTKYFHALMRGRMRRLFIHKICHETRIDERILQHLPTLVTPEQNMILQEIPNMEELKQVVLSMNPNTGHGPDGFVRGRNIAENIILAQEITYGIKKPKEGDNVIIKLDMTKAYDRVSWAYTCLVLRKMGFGDVFIDIVWRIMSNNWYSIIINGRRHGFFHSTRGLKQGDPISPALFILGAEVLSRMLNLLNYNMSYKGFSQKDSPITYLGCPLYIGRQRIIYYSQLVDKVAKRISGWQTRFLSFGGRVTLIKYVLQSIPINTMAATLLPNTTIKYMKCIIADFFWGNEGDKKKYHWASWESLSFPCEEGGIGVRMLSDICTSLQFKHWWLFKTKESHWEQFLRAKYCRVSHPAARKWDNTQYMLKNRSMMEKNIRWKINSGNCSFWWDDWLGVGALGNLINGISSQNNTKVHHFLLEGKLNEFKLRQQVPL
ncbi:uncharacterized protein [Solanum tuberosum]|uniref:uncharacterized protein n=1 Tax=Solanum tuberosum TaxID=4113 RepID=UPI00073A4D2F|nr:PREDICTED: uncharacterized protein LOC107057776 [Solanum tuberosum]